jgi:PAS domain S-box-containing protein
MTDERTPEASVLFLSARTTVRSPMARWVAQAVAPSSVRIVGAGIEPTDPHPLAVAAMQGRGVEPTDTLPVSIEEVGTHSFDLIVTMCAEARRRCPILPGCPATLHWDIDDPGATDGDEARREAAFARVAGEIDDRVRRLFCDGYFRAFLRQKENLLNILGSLSEGVLAHDLNRRIFYFSRGAQRLTGFAEADVVGRDCHEIFAPSLCGENCSFCRGCEGNEPVAARYSTVMLGAQGDRRELDVSVVPLKDSEDETVGVVASLTDTTAQRNLERRLKAEQEFRGMIGQDHAMQHIYGLIRDLAQCDFSVVVGGESGTGKELVARAIHNESARRDAQFVPVNCGALPEGTLESELFGHVKGAFTGAIRDKKGRFELANGGTLFLDEVGELPQSMQVKLLRVLQEGTVEPVGSESSRKVDVRIICATNRDLREMVDGGEFRDDLYYRLAVVPITVPPLRERRNDIPLLAQRFLDDISGSVGREGMALSDEAMSVLASYAWPGNVRQLQNAIQFTLIRCHDTLILPHHLPPEIIETTPLIRSTPPSTPGKVGRKPKLMRDSVAAALTRAGGNKAKAARILGVGRATLYNFLKDHADLVVPADAT